MVNDELFVKVLAQIERDPQHWDQDDWAHRGLCGTTYCLAGWAVHLSGIPLNWDDSYADDSAAFTKDGRLIEAVAEQLLGITQAQSEDLFTDTDTNYQEVYKKVSAIMGVDEQVLRDKVREQV